MRALRFYTPTPNLTFLGTSHTSHIGKNSPIWTSSISNPFSQVRMFFFPDLTSLALALPSAAAAEEGVAAAAFLTAGTEEGLGVAAAAVAEGAEAACFFSDGAGVDAGVPFLVGGSCFCLRSAAVRLAPACRECIPREARRLSYLPDPRSFVMSPEACPTTSRAISVRAIALSPSELASHLRPHPPPHPHPRPRPRPHLRPHLRPRPHLRRLPLAGHHHLTL